MGMSVDRTGEFRRYAVDFARLSGCNEAQLLRVSSAALMRPVSQRGEFEAVGVGIMRSIETMSDFVTKSRAVFLHPERATDRERDSIESEVGLFVRTCKESVDQLQARVRALTHPSKHRLAHLQGMVLILSERLKAATERFDECRAARYQAALAAWGHTRRLRRDVDAHVQAGAAGQSDDAYEPRHQQHPQQQQQQMVHLDAEGDMLAQELQGLVDQVRETEGRVVEISTLNHLFSTQIVQQAQQIEKLYQEALQTTLNVETGNVELRKAASYGGSGRKYVVMIFLFASLILLVLDYITK